LTHRCSGDHDLGPQPQLGCLLLASTCTAFVLHGTGPLRYLHSFPTRRSSDLENRPCPCRRRWHHPPLSSWHRRRGSSCPGRWRRDRKSTRLNSSHGSISYAVFGLKKNNTAKLLAPNDESINQLVSLSECHPEA